MTKKTLTKLFSILALVAISGFLLSQVEADTQLPQVNIWWPTNNSNVTGIQPFKAALRNWTVDQYNMYWQVDNGTLNYMPTNTNDYPHKEANVDLTNWHWSPNGVYHIGFVAKDFNGNTIAQGLSNIIVNAPEVITPVATPVSSAAPSWAAPTAVATNQNEGIFHNAKLFVNPNSDAKKWAEDNRESRSADASTMEKIAQQPETQWFGSWNSDIYEDVKSNVKDIAEQDALPVMVAYNIPQRDCGGYSAGGSGSPDAYRAWISDFAKAIGHHKAAVILEPDALAGIGCLSSGDQQIRIDLIRFAVQKLKQNSHTAVYIDAGHANWRTASDIAGLLNQAGINEADGFSLNIANFISNDQSIAYGTEISKMVGNKHFVIDTGRNGSGSTGDAQWCNPSGRALGMKPGSNTGNELVDAFLWVKGPSGSDGQCNGGPAAGQFWPDYALGLASRTDW
ncbi:MAG: hypothetical protein NVSMB66_6790 [Candidatus Doudnabacteria bacterium]